jgi:prepilin-type N-terminal cleavage/methylation domain-containing protein
MGDVRADLPLPLKWRAATELPTLVGAPVGRGMRSSACISRVVNSRPARTLRGHAGMTLIEIMIVIAVMGLLVSGATIGARSLPRTRLRTSAVRLASTFRFAYVHALTTGRTTRVSFPMGGRDIVVEDTDDAHTLDVNDPFHAGGAADIEADAVRQAREMTDLRPRAPRASFRPLPSRVFHARALETGISVTRLYSQHDPEPREEGTGHVYFFPGGQTERSVVHLRNNNGEFFSISLNPLTGRTEIFDRPVEPPTIDDRDATDQDEVDNRDRTAPVPTEVTR